MTVEALLEEIRALPLAERRRLAHLVLDTLAEPDVEQKKYSILEFAGFASHLADDEDPQDYINRLRDEWDNDD